MQEEHVGTHMDAPAHFSPGKWKLHEIPFERLAGEAVVVDITEKASKDPVRNLAVFPFNFLF